MIGSHDGGQVDLPCLFLSIAGVAGLYHHDQPVQVFFFLPFLFCFKTTINVDFTAGWLFRKEMNTFFSLNVYYGL